MEVKDRVTGLHQHKLRLVPYLLSEIWLDKQIQRWRGKERAREREKAIDLNFIPLPSVGPADQYSAGLNQQKGECL